MAASDKNSDAAIRANFSGIANLESFMKTKQLTQRQARWAETLGCFDFEIVFCPGRHASRLDVLSRRLDLAPESEEKLSFGSILKPENITE
ncbi:hypothetical protein PCANC_11624 [Puccinia coronata f. sp. avenae]|uniref:Uncharacterized protein n=1 Tax=Puccinia coronata f. sp. avenae TaxID=200324 RepID=A0A2N5SVJ9_9BASI|nr:hypothetical protein PCANC_11624 [Puccinia coronata f. sp. avenae]